MKLFIPQLGIVCNMATSALNPNAPMFVPSAYRAVEDFSDQWWDLVHSTPWFRDYWLRECFSDPLIDSPFLDITGEDFHNDDAITDDVTKGNRTSRSKADSTFSSHRIGSLVDSDLDLVFPAEKEAGNMDLVSLGWLKWRKPRGGAEMPRYCEKAPKFVSMRVNPKPIQQPR
ncbi:hypothetical protein DH2020_030454 [Rehmannia glutinosa]|uniref:Uncharacterized protein n=1 Tax=Rehmannia glutinosa TaxID=99300 RepID=A0ABR0VKN9_REHGL